MAITIQLPLTGTAANPTKLAKKFVAMGKKAATEIPLGLLYSVGANGKPDGKVLVSGSYLTHKKLQRTQWALFFRVPRAKPDQRFALIVLNAANLPTDINVTGAAKLDYLNFLKRTRTDRGVDARATTKMASSASIGFDADHPTSGTSLPKDAFFAYGYLPSGDYDINPLECEVDGNNNDNVNPDWSWTDGNGFWAAFWPELTPTDVGETVKINLTYLPSDSEESILDIKIT